MADTAIATNRGTSEASEAVSTTSSALQRCPTQSSKNPSIANTAEPTPIAARIRSRSASVTAAASANGTKRTAPPVSDSTKNVAKGTSKTGYAKASDSSATPPPPRAPSAKKAAHFESHEPTTNEGVQSVLSSPSAPATARVGRSGVPVIDLSTSVSSRAGPSSKPTEKSPANTTKKIGPVPQPDVDKLQQAKSKQQEATQSTATQDTIKQFSSPLRPEWSGEQRKERQKKREEAVAKDTARAEKEEAKGKGRAKAKRMMIDGGEVLTAPDTDEEEEEANAEHAAMGGIRTPTGKETGAGARPRIVKRIIDGEEVLVAEDTDDEDVPEIAAVEMEIAPAASVREAVVMVDQSIQAEVAEMTTAATMTDASPLAPEPAKMVDMAMETVAATVVQQADAEVPNVILDVGPIPVS